MTAVFLLLAAVLLATLAAGIALVMRAPARSDSLLVALLAATTGVAIILLLGKALAAPYATDIALVFGMLAAVLGVTFVARGWPVESVGPVEND